MQREFPDRPFVGAGAVVLRGREILLIRRARPPRLGEWSLPGGLIELGETALEAALREVAEETGVAAAPLGLLDVVDAVLREPDGRVRTHYTLVDFALRWTGGEPEPGGDAAEAAWFAESDIAGLRMWPETERVIALALQRYAQPRGSSV